MKPFVRILLFALLHISCAALNVNIPETVFVDKTFKSQFNASKEDFDKVPQTGGIGFVLIVPPTSDITCPKGAAGVSPSFLKNFDDRTFVKKPDNASEFNGDLLMTPQKTGTHSLCAYAVSFTSDDSEPDRKRGGGQDFNFLKFFENAVLLFASPQFEVGSPSNGGSSMPTTLTATPALSSTGTDGDDGDDKKGRREHQLLHQAPPPSILASTLTSPSHYPVYGAASPPPAGIRSPGSPTTTIRPTSHIPLGFDETMQKSYHFPSVGSSPSSYSVPLPHEPALRAQHGSGVGASNV
ncbi:hypothetical protein PQX77_002723 [Marasmius sp. AFHP31]|nr:hypothetical protein PQX77_002723 [Marasmius sp. AFHP31]